MSDALLPAGFESLAAFVEFWAKDTAAARAQQRDLSDEAGRVAFYNAAMDLVPPALALLDAKPLADFDAREQRLMNLMLSFTHVALAVELQRDDEPRHTSNRRHMHITRAPADRAPSHD